MAGCCAEAPNYGVPSCLENIAPIVKIYFQKTYDSNGNLNYFQLNDFAAETLADYLGKDSSVDEGGQKLYPTGFLNNVELPKADTQFEDASNGVKSFLSEGKRTFTGELWDSEGNHVIKKKLASKRCSDWSFFMVTESNQLVCERFYLSGVEFVKGIKLDKQSVDPKFMFQTNSTTQKTILSFDFDRYFDDGNLYVLFGDEMWSNVTELPVKVDFINPKPKFIDVTFTITNVTATTVEFKLEDDYRSGTQYLGSSGTGKGLVTGLGVNNFEAYNVTDALAVTLTTVVENSDGNYTATFVAQSATDIVEIKTKVTLRSVEYFGSKRFVAE